MEDRKKLPVMSRLGVIFLTWRRYLEKSTKMNGLTLNQFFILKQLMKKEYLNPSEIAELLYCDRPTATVIIDNLKKYGYVTKDKDIEDGKRIQVKITEKGLELIKHSEEAMSKEANFEPLSCFSVEEKRTFEELLIKLHQHMKQIR